MDTQRTLARAMVDHWAWAARKGLITEATASTLSTSCRHVLRVDPNWETLDVQTLDVDEYILRFNNLSAGKYKPRSLKDYGSRFRRAVASYRSYLEDPTSWRFAPSRRQPASRSDGSTPTKRGRTSPSEDMSTTKDESVGVVSHEYSFPIRPDLMARLAIPRDVTTAEINRLVAWARTLAVDYEPSP